MSRKKRSRKASSNNRGCWLVFLLLLMIVGCALELPTTQGAGKTSSGCLGSLILLLSSIALLVSISFPVFQDYWRSRREETRYRALKLADVDNMNPYEFEHYVAKLMTHRGYRAEVTHSSGDSGVDIVAAKEKVRYAVQVKRHKGGVSRRAVSDAVAGAALYKCNAAMVVTNSYFTDGAKQLAEANGCRLIDRDVLAQWIQDYHRVEAER